jgi:hypothetical protein
MTVRIQNLQKILLRDGYKKEMLTPTNGRSSDSDILLKKRDILMCTSCTLLFLVNLVNFGLGITTYDTSYAAVSPSSHKIIGTYN